MNNNSVTIAKYDLPWCTVILTQGRSVDDQAKLSTCIHILVIIIMSDLDDLDSLRHSHRLL